MTEKTARFAIYLAPPPDSALAERASAWLGRNAADGTARPRPPLPWIDADEAEAITAAPRHYGFHGTLKAPFALAEGRDETALIAAFEDFARERTAFRIALKIGVLDGFLALVPAAPCPPLCDLADACVEQFDHFRAPPSDQELARRRRADLSPEQDAHLVRWGYPYVFDTFRFHMTLTSRLDSSRRDAVLEGLTGMFADLVAEPVRFDSLFLFAQPSRSEPFRIIRRHPLGRPA